MKLHDVSTAPPAIGHFSHAVEANGFVFLSGQGPIDPDNGSMPEGIVAQTALTLENLRAILEGIGLSLENVVRFNIYLKRAEDFQSFNRTFSEVLGEHKPARTTVCPPLLGEILVEIDCIAAR